MSDGVLLAIDPGNHTGWAAFQLATGELEACGGVTPNEPIGRYQPALVAIELPRQYLRGKADPDDIIKLAVKVGRYVERFGGPDGRRCDIRLVKPSEWKGSIEKAQMTSRIDGALTPAERALVARSGCPKSMHDDMLDAVGLGKWVLKQRRLDAALRAPVAA